MQYVLDDRGLSLTEVLVALGLFSLTALASAELTANQAKSLRGNRLILARDEIAHRIDRLAGDPRALAASAASTSAANTRLQGCIQGCAGGANCCENTLVGFELLDPEGVQVSGAGTTPKFYGSNGEESGCSTASATCPIAVSTEFKPICPNGAASCAQAAAVEVYYKVTQANDVSGQPVRLLAGPPLRKVANSSAIITGVPLDLGGGGGGAVTGTQNFLAKFVSPSQLATSQIFEDPGNGRIGIGTGAPRSALSVYGASDSTITLHRSSLPNTVAVWQYNIGTTFFGTTEHDDLAFMTNGTVRMRIDADGNITQPSDRRLKKNIVPIGDAITRLQGLKGVRYHWKDAARGRTEQIGLIAQDVERAFPQLVSRDESGVRSVSYIGLIAPVVEAIKQLYVAVTAASEENRQLKLKLATIEARLAALETRR